MKKPTSSSKKRGHNKNKNSPSSMSMSSTVQQQQQQQQKIMNQSQQLITMGDDAMQSLDIEAAANYYQQAVMSLSSIVATTNNNNNNNNSIVAIHDDSHDTKPSISLLADVLGKLGETKVSLANPDGARDDFEQAIDLLLSSSSSSSVAQQQPSTQLASLYLYLGQVSMEEDALQAYQKGIAQLETCLTQLQLPLPSNATTSMTATATPTTTVTEVRHQLVRAHCTVAELYLTDLCYAEDAEETCQAHVDSAFALMSNETVTPTTNTTTPTTTATTKEASPMVDVLQVLTSLRLSQQRKDDARESILQVYAHMKEGCEALATLVGLKEPSTTTTTNNDEDDDDNAGTAVELSNVDAVHSLPGFEFRCQTAKLLLECATTTPPSTASTAPASMDTTGTPSPSTATTTTITTKECVLAAISVLGSLLAENDEVIEIYYLLGCAFEMYPNLSNNDNNNHHVERLSLAHYYYHQALDMVQKVMTDLKSETTMDVSDDQDDEEEHVMRQLQECETQLQDIQSKLHLVNQTLDSINHHHNNEGEGQEQKNNNSNNNDHDDMDES